MPPRLAKLLAIVCAALAMPAAAQEYPARPVKIIVPFATGGPADVYARYIGARLQETMGQPFVIENRPGAGAVTGTDAAAKSAPDGYTLLLMSNAHTVNETLIPNKPYALLRDFVPVAPINYSDLLLVVNPAVKAATLGEFIALAKSQPGKLNYAVGNGDAVPHGRRAVQGDGGRGHRARAVQGEFRGAHRRSRRAGGDDARRGNDDERAGEGRQGQGARDHRQDALVGHAQPADRLRSGRARLRAVGSALAPKGTPSAVVGSTPNHQGREQA
jgi:hypothetical protein